MSNITLLALIRKELKDSWKNEKVFIEHGNGYSKRRDQHDSALMAVEQLMERLAEPEVPAPSLL